MANITEVYEHDIKWSVDAEEVTELDDATIAYIEEKIGNGYTSGQLCVTYGEDNNEETNGWWQLINWKNIALELYNAIGDPVKEEKAKKNFDENWA